MISSDLTSAAGRSWYGRDSRLCVHAFWRGCFFG